MEKNEGHTVVIVDEIFKSFSCDDGKELEDQVGDHLVAIEITRSAELTAMSERFRENGSCSKRKQHTHGEWWKNHILVQHGEE